jgi:hypothetical protein
MNNLLALRMAYALLIILVLSAVLSSQVQFLLSDTEPVILRLPLYGSFEKTT